jgi:cardiolipin synthase
MMLNLPNFLTLFRLLLLVPIIALFFLEATWGASAAWLCLLLYAIASITDFFDGYLARKLNQITPLGTFLDPISDKIFVSAVLIALVGFDRLPGLWMIAVILILSREFLVSGLREFLGPKNIQLPVTKLAKWKTALQMIATGFLVIGPYAPYTLLIGQWGLAAAAALTAMTGWIYVRACLPVLIKG